MPRYLTRTVQVALDLTVLSLAFWLGCLFRFEFAIPQHWALVCAKNWPFILAVQYGFLALFGVPRFSWRYVSLRETERIGVAISLASTLLVAVRIVVGELDGSIELGVMPLGVLSIDFSLALVGLVAIRALRRRQGEAKARRLRHASGEVEGKRVLLIGAGEAGVLVAREIAARPDLGLVPVGFLDDDPLKVGMTIGGLRVIGTTQQLAQLAARKHVKRALITIANASGTDIRRILEVCREARIETRIIPGIYEIVGDKLNLSRIREVAIEDLLGREPVRLDEDEVGASIRNAVVMVTGAGGSIGSELCRQICRFQPRRLLLVERFENALFEIHRELIAAFPHCTIDPVIADVCDATRMEQVFAARPALVFHAAAHKHVPMMEANVGEAVKNNVRGTRTVADLANRFGASRFVLVSTDKAVNPTSVMGATKRLAETYVQALAQSSETRFVTVRFGNVLGSNGSVIPIFKQQIAIGGPVTVTDAKMERYFMTIPEASQLVLQAGAMGQGGEIFILDMGKPVKIVDLARDLITLSGFRPDEDIEIKFTGVRPGEKLFEELSTAEEVAVKTKHPKIFIGRVTSAALDEVDRGQRELLAAADRADAPTLRSMIGSLIPEYKGGAAPPVPTETAKPGRRTDANPVLTTIQAVP